MNRKQKLTIVIGAAAVVTLALFPPFTLVGLNGAETDSVYTTRFRWFLEDMDMELFRNVDNRLVGLQIAVVAVTVAVAILLSDRKAKPLEDAFR